MSFQLVARPGIKTDLLEASSWYDSKAAGLGRDFLREVDRQFELIESNPLLYAPIYRGVRGCQPRRLPYVIYYRIRGDIIQMIAVRHGRQHHSTWRNRL